jgi:hypothetical protein
MDMKKTALAIAVLACAGTAHAQPSATLLPSSMVAEGLSPDGTVVFGRTYSGPRRPVYWTRSGGIVDIGLPPAGTEATVTASNWDGSVLSVNSTFTQGTAVTRWAWIWRSATGFSEIAVPDMIQVQATCLSRDGSTVAGAAVDPTTYQYHAISWTATEGGRLVPQGGNYASWIHALSPNGLRAVGSGASPQGSWPMFWASTYVWCTSLGTLPGMRAGFSFAMTPDSSTIVGEFASVGSGGAALIWTASEGLSALEILPGTGETRLQTISDDGRLAGGWSGSPGGYDAAILWQRGQGLTRARTFLTARGLPVGNYYLAQIVGISASGRVICTPQLLMDLGACGSADFNHDGSSGTDSDIEVFFACLAGNCCPLCDSADFDGDGDSATDGDIEAFFRVLAGGSC